MTYPLQISFGLPFYFRIGATQTRWKIVDVSKQPNAIDRAVLEDPRLIFTAFLIDFESRSVSWELGLGTTMIMLAKHNHAQASVSMLHPAFHCHYGSPMSHEILHLFKALPLLAIMPQCHLHHNLHGSTKLSSNTTHIRSRFY